MALMVHYMGKRKAGAGAERRRSGRRTRRNAVQLRRLALPDPDPWFEALASRAPWLMERLPYGDADLTERAAADRYDGALRPALADALVAQARRLGAGVAALEAIERL